MFVTGVQTCALPIWKLAAAGTLEELTAGERSLEEVFMELTGGNTEEETGEEEAE